MELELRNKEGLFMVSFKEPEGSPFFKALLNEKKLTLTIKRVKEERDSCRVFINNTDQNLIKLNQFVRLQQLF